MRSLLIKPALTTSKCLDGNLADACVGTGGCTIGRALMKPVIKGTPMPTSTPTRHPWSWLISVPHHGGVPQTCTVTTLQLSHLQKLVRVNWVDFSISLFSSCTNVWCAGETLHNLSASFNPFLAYYFFFSTMWKSHVYIWKENTTENPHLLLELMNLQWNRKSQY